MDQFVFKVPTKGLCVMCLTDDVPVTDQNVSLGVLRSFLNLDYRKVFGITSNFLEENENHAEVDIQVTLCRSCSDLRSKFCNLFEEMTEIKKKMSGCIETMLTVMIDSESNVIRSKRFKEKISGVSHQAFGADSAVAAVLKTTIPYKFRMEAIQKCVAHVEEAMKKLEISPQPPPEQIPMVKEKEEEEVNMEEMLELESSYPDFGELEANRQDEDLLSDEDDEMKLDEDADPEELMMRYNLMPEKFSTGDASMSTPSSSGSIPNAGISNGGSPAKNGHDAKSSFNSRFKCEICGKVVVSLKNFELHQRRHTGEKPFACPFCEQHFRDTSNLRSHALRYHRQFLFFKFRYDSMTDEEFRIALDKIVVSIVQNNEDQGAYQSHKCLLCQKDYTQKYAIEDHIVQRHYDVLSTALIQIQAEVKDYTLEDIASYLSQIYANSETCNVCGLCGESFESGIEVNNHMKIHVRVQVTRGEVANRKSEASDSLIQLKMKCNICSKFFEDLHGLKLHKELHQGNCASSAIRESDYNCEHCGRSFCSYYSQRSHVLAFHRYEVFSRYLPPGTTSEEIEVVVKRITGKYLKLPNGLFQCSLCRKEITQLRKLQNHMLVTHFDEVAMKVKKAIDQIRGNYAGSKRKPIMSNELGDLPVLEHFENANNGESFSGDDYNGEIDADYLPFNMGIAAGSLEYMLSGFQSQPR